MTEPEFNSLAPERFYWNYRKMIFKLILVTDGWDISSEIALRWTSRDLSDKSTLVQVMAWCHQATSHYLNQCWPRSLSPYGVTKPQWVKWEFEPMKDIPYLALTGELWGVFRDDFGEKWPGYRGSTLYTGPKLSHHCTYRWPSAVRCRAISRHSVNYEARQDYFKFLSWHFMTWNTVFRGNFMK